MLCRGGINTSGVWSGFGFCKGRLGAMWGRRWMGKGAREEEDAFVQGEDGGHRGPAGERRQS